RRKLSVMRLKWCLRIGLHGYEKELPLEELNPYISHRVRGHHPSPEVYSLVKALWNA
ncbi:unnamed protein product, partial [marine sediment metagenome]